MRVREAAGSGRGLALGLVVAAALVLALVVITRSDDEPREVVELTARALDVAVASSPDDATETLSTGLVEIQSADLELGRDLEPQLVGLRFADLQIPPGSTITSAVVQFASARYTDADTVLTFTGEATDDAAVFTRVAGDLSSRPSTGAVVEWQPPTWFGVGELGPDQRSPDLTAVISEIVSRPGWHAGNAIAIFVTGSGRRSAESFDGPLGLPPVLRVTWEEPAGGNRPPVVDAGTDERIDLGRPVALSAAATDDTASFAAGTLTARWSVAEGDRDAVTFSDDRALDPTVTFDAPGAYVLELVVSDGEIARQDRVAVTVVDPDAALPPIRFAVIGDYGLPGPGESVVAALVEAQAPDFVVTVGDNAYVPDIDDAVGAYYASFIGDYRGSFGQGSAVNRFFPAIGNHEETDLAGGLDDYLDYFDLPGEGVESTNSSGNERYYDFVQGPVHFFILNSSTGEPDGRDATSVQAQWLERTMSASTAPWQIVVAHHPPYSSDAGAGETPVMRWPFAAWGADAVLTGHAHVYERIVVDDLLYFVNGIGGEGASSLADQPLPGNRMRYNGGFGAMLIEACAERIEFSLHTVNQGVVDTYAMGSTDCSGATPIDQEPYAYAGLDATVATGARLDLGGVVDDDGSVTARWTQASGPGVATFSNAQLATSAVTFDLPGVYVLALEASDGTSVATDTVEVVVTDHTYRRVEVAATDTADDAEQRLSSGLVQIESTDLGLGVGSQPQLVGIRFGPLPIPRGATIERAYVQFEVDEVERATASLDIVGQLSGNAAPFSEAQLDISARPTTAARVSWVPPEWPALKAAGPAQRTPDLSRIVQEVVDQREWAAGNALAFVIAGTGTRTAESADGQPGGEPVLHVEYSVS